MIDFIIHEENLLYSCNYLDAIEQVLMNYDVEYDITYYDNNKNNYRKLENKHSFKVFLFGSENNVLNSIKYIREELDDWQSMIIVLTNSEQLKYKLLDSRLLLVDIIDKSTNYLSRLKSDIQICLKNYDKRPNKLKYTYKKIIYNIDLYKILYIEKEQDNKRCIIYTNESKYYIQGNLVIVEKLLDKRFIKVSRSYIINLEQVSSYDNKKNIINLKNNKKLIGIVSRNNKKTLQRRLRKI